MADLRPPRAFTPKVAYEELDVRDRERARRLVAHERPDVLVHLAFVLNPIHDEHAMYEIDVGGTQNVLEAASAAGTEHVLVTSSTTAYGAFADNPVPLTEDHPVRGVPDFEYARDKAESDRLCQLWGLEHPDRTMTIVRPCIVFGPERRQLHRPHLHRPALLRRPGGRSADPVRARGRRGRGAAGTARRAPRRGLQCRPRRLDDGAGVRRADRPAPRARALRRLPGPRPDPVAAAAHRDAGREPPLRSPPLGGLERADQGRARLGAAVLEPGDLRADDACARRRAPAASAA